MLEETFVDYYELLELSPKARTETIERVFRHLAKEHHPDVASKADVQKFSVLVDAFDMLRDPETRAAYDIAYSMEKQKTAEVVKLSKETKGDTADRLTILSLLYAKRRKDMRNPGVGVSSIGQMIDCTEEVVEFHLWYFREKGWIKREESGQLSITAAGVDYIESANLPEVMASDRLITQGKPISVQNNDVCEIICEG